MKKLFLLTLLCPVLMGVALTSTSTNVVSDPVVENFVETGDVEVLPIDETGAESKFVGNKGAVVGGQTTAYSETYYQLGEAADGKNLIRFATAVKGNLKTLTYDLTYNGNTQQVNVERVYKAISVNGVTTYYGEEGMTTDATQSTYYWACFTLKFNSESAINTTFEAKLNILDKAANTFATKNQHTTLGGLKYGYNDVTIDGVMNDAIYTDRVRSNVWSFKASDRTSMDLYATRNDKGIYFFVNYYSTENSTSLADHVDWWRGENFEFRIMGEYGCYMNRYEFINNPTNIAQYWASAYYGGVNSNFENFYISTPTLNAETNLYEVRFELFASYDYLYAEADDVIGFYLGTNPGGSGFLHDGYWNNNNVFQNKKITKNGIKFSLSEDDCLKHKLGAATVTKTVSCTEDGLQKRTCTLCNVVVEEVVPHQRAYNISDLVVDTPATCSTIGVGHGSCTTCGSIHNDAIVDCNQYNHEAFDSAKGSCAKCKGTLSSAVVNSINGSQWGWGGVGSWTYLAMNLSGDYSVTAKYRSVRNLNSGQPENSACHALSVVQEELPAGIAGEGSCWVTRLDWWMWCDQWQSSSRLTDALNTNEDGGNNGGINGAHDEEWLPWATANEILKDYTCEVVFTRKGNICQNVFYITDTNGNTYRTFSRIPVLDTTKNLSLALVAEHATFTVEQVYHNNVTFAA